MDLYLMQHGQATTEREDPERPDGCRSSGGAACRWESPGCWRPDQRLPAQRKAARRADCAVALVREIGVEPTVEARPGLAPNDPVVPVAQWRPAETDNQSLALVGHMPFLGRLASLLVVGVGAPRWSASRWVAW